MPRVPLDPRLVAVIVREVQAPMGTRERCFERCPYHGVYSWIRQPGSNTVRECWDCQGERRAREREQRRRARSIREPPRPPYEDVEDTCSMCGASPLPARRRSWCSDDCVDLWDVATSGHAARHHLGKLHGYRCFQCDARWQPGTRHRHDLLGAVVGHPAAPLELFVDHVRPLWSLTEQERTELRWWLPFNLQLLCRTCHGDKTAAEAAERAELRRARA